MRHFQRNYIFLLNFFFVVLITTEIEARVNQDPSKNKKIKDRPVDADPPQSRCVVDEYMETVIDNNTVAEMNSYCREMYPMDTNGNDEVAWYWNQNNKDDFVYYPANFEGMENCRNDESKQHCPTDKEYIECHDDTNVGFYIINYIYEQAYEENRDRLEELKKDICPPGGFKK